MNTTKRERIARFYGRMSTLGFTFSEADNLRRIEMTLHRWAEAECNGDIQRDGEAGDGKPYREYGNYVAANDPRRRHYVPDRERGALKRLAALMKGRSGLWYYHQGDPRGCALYVGKGADRGALPVDQAYNRGVAVCF